MPFSMRAVRDVHGGSAHHGRAEAALKHRRLRPPTASTSARGVDGWECVCARSPTGRRCAGRSSRSRLTDSGQRVGVGLHEHVGAVAEEVGGRSDLADVGGVSHHVGRRRVSEAVRGQARDTGVGHEALERLVVVAGRTGAPVRGDQEAAVGPRGCQPAVVPRPGSGGARWASLRRRGIDRESATGSGVLAVTTTPVARGPR